MTTFARRTFTFDKNVCGVIVDPTTVTEEVYSGLLGFIEFLGFRVYSVFRVFRV